MARKFQNSRILIRDSDWLNCIHFSGYKIRLVSRLRKREDQALISISTILKFLAHKRVGIILPPCLCSIRKNYRFLQSFFFRVFSLEFFLQSFFLRVFTSEFLLESFSSKFFFRVFSSKSFLSSFFFRVFSFEFFLQSLFFRVFLRVFSSEFFLQPTNAKREVLVIEHVAL